MNKRKGFKRLALAVGIPYFGFWALMWAASSANRDSNFNLVVKYTNEKNDRMREIYAKAYSESISMEQLALLWGVVVPVLALIVGGIAYWVYRGFKPKVEAE